MQKFQLPILLLVASLLWFGFGVCCFAEAEENGNGPKSEFSVGGRIYLSDYLEHTGELEINENSSPNSNRVRMEIKENLCKITCRMDEEVQVCMEVYPALPKLNDVIYCVCYLENLTEKTIPEVVNFDGIECALPYNPHPGYFRSKISSKDLPPKGKNIIYTKTTVIRSADKRMARDGRSYYRRCYMSMPTGKVYAGKEHFALDVFASVMWDRFEERPLKEVKTLETWLARAPLIRSAATSVVETHPAPPKYDETLPVPTGEDLYDIYLGDIFLKADENRLEEPSTSRDEICLTRLILDWLKGAGTLDAVTEFVSSRPFPQKYVMTQRLHRKEDFFPGTYGRWTTPPPPLPSEWEAKLQRLNAAFLEIRENALEK